ncbi:MAG TPA: ABC transporter permease subunit [Gaiellaceae bacterium]
MACENGRLITTTEAASEALRPGTRSGRRRLSLAWLGTLPFFAYALLFLFLPAGQVLTGAFKSKTGEWTFSNLHTLVQKPYITYYETSIKISLVTAIAGCLLGLAIAYAAIREGTPRWIRGMITTFSGVAANFGGIPLAFAFIATIGNVGIVTRFLNNVLGWDIYSTNFPIFGQFTLFSAFGVGVVYMYFQIPLMILVIAPAIDGLRREWREAASNLGASAWQFWRYVGVPVLLPSLLGATILLFGNAFAAYATAYSLTAGSVGLVPIQIGYLYSGNVLDDPHLAQALAFGMFCVLAGMMLIYIPLARRSARWMR